MPCGKERREVRRVEGLDAGQQHRKDSEAGIVGRAVERGRHLGALPSGDVVRPDEDGAGSAVYQSRSQFVLPAGPRRKQSLSNQTVSPVARSLRATSRTTTVSALL
jgi:hypothetical protein